MSHTELKKESLNISKLRNANSVFVPGNLLEKFLKESADNLKAKVLITGNSD
jgi:hypothetical protein